MSRRFLITIGQSDCQGFGAGHLPCVADDIARIGEFFTQSYQGYAWELRELANNPSTEQVRTALGTWAAAPERSPEDCLILFWTGHGTYDQQFGEHVLLTQNSLDRRQDTVLRTQELVTLICGNDSFPQSLLIVLDVCFAAHGAGEFIVKTQHIGRHFRDGAGVWILSASDAVSSAFDGAFVSAFLDVTRDPNWAPRGGAEFISPKDIALGVNRHFEKIAHHQSVVSHHAFGGRKQEPFVRNPNYDGGRGERILEDEGYWWLKASGADAAGYPGWFFSGRGKVLRNLVDYLHATTPLRARVVTGAPGSGKSAILGLLTTAADHSIVPDLRAEVIGSLGTDLAIPVYSFQARGLQSHGLLDALSTRLGAESPSMSSIRDVLSRLARPVAILIDSLDESPQPGQIEHSILRPLSAQPNVRLIIATRKVGQRVPMSDLAEVLDLDREYFDPEDVANYAFGRLTSAKLGAPFAAEDRRQAARDFSKRIAIAANHSFLYARIVTRWLLSELPSPVLRLPALPDSLSLAFRQDLERFGARDRDKILHLLLPLAYSRGRGLPHKNIWAAAATRMSGQRYDSADVAWLIEKAGYFLIQDVEHGETVYRPYHESFAEHLRAGRAGRIDHAAIAQGLVDSLGVAGAKAGPWMSLSEPYIVHHFAAHAARGDMLLPFLREPEFLLSVSPESLTAELLGNSAASELRELRIYRRAAAKIRTSDRPTGAAYLAVAALQEGATEFADRLAHYRPQAAWWPTWCDWEAQLGGFNLAKTGHQTTAMLPFTDADGESWAACGHADGSVSLWKVPSGECVFRKGWTENTQEVRHLVLAASAAGMHFIAGTDDKISVLDFTGAVLAERNLRGIRAIVYCEAHQAVAIAFEVGKEGATIRLVSAARLEDIATREHAAAAAIYALEIISFRGAVALAAGSDSAHSGRDREPSPLRVWSLPDLKPEYASKAPDVRNVRYLTPVCVAGRSLLAVSAIFGFELTLWDPENDIFHLIYDWNSRHERVDRVLDAETIGDEVMLLCSVDGQLAKLKLSVDRPTGGIRSQGTVHALPQLFKELSFSAVFAVSGRRTLLAAHLDELYVLDVAETLSADRNVAAPTLRSFATSLVETRSGKVLTSTREGEVLLRSADGKIVWRVDLRKRVAGACWFDGPEANILLVDDGGKGTVVRESSGEVMSTGFVFGNDVTCVSPVVLSGEPHVAVAVNDRQTGVTGEWAVRIWNPRTMTEVDSEVVRLGKKKYRFQTSDPSKRVQAIDVFDGDTGQVMCFAGPHGEVQYASLNEPMNVFEEWGAGSESEYLSALCSVDRHGERLLFAGGDWGRLYSCSFATDTTHREPIDLRQGSINALIEARSASSRALVVGTERGAVQLLSLDAADLGLIELSSTIWALAMLPGLQLIVGTRRGVMSFALNPAALAGNPAR